MRHVVGVAVVTVAAAAAAASASGRGAGDGGEGGAGPGVGRQGGIQSGGLILAQRCLGGRCADLGLHRGLPGDGQGGGAGGACGADAGGAPSLQQPLHIIQLRPFGGGGRGTLQSGSDLTLSAVAPPPGDSRTIVFSCKLWG